MEFKKLIQDSEHKINNDSFNLRKLKQLYSKKYRGFCVETGQLKDFTDAKKYMLKYLFPVEGGYMMNANGSVEFKSMELFRKTYMSRLGSKEYDDLKGWFFSTDDVYRRVCIPNRQLIKDDTINIVGAFKHNNDMKYSECDQDSKDGVEMMLKFILDVWCSGDNVQYEYIINWIANMIQGNKNQTLLYAKSTTEGIGKSTLTEFLMDYVIGHNLSIQASSSVLLTANNHSLFGKLFVCFEELKSSKSEWAKISSCLKEWITSDTISYNEKYMIGFNAKNINNYIINTNTEAVKGANGRRYFIADLSTKYKGKFDFWDQLHNNCFNDNTGKAFYLYMLEHNVSKFNSSKLPMTQRKKDSISKLLNPVYKFIKFNYLLCGKEIKRITRNDFWDEYRVYCNKTDAREYDYRAFNALMKELNWDYKKSGNNTYWIISLEQIKETARLRNWCSDIDSEIMEQHVIWDEFKTVAEVAVCNMFQATEYEDIINKQKEQLSEQQKQIEELKKQLAELQKVNDIPEPAPDTPNLFKKSKKKKSKKKKSKRKKSKKSKSKKKKKVVKKKNDNSDKLDAWETIKITI